MRYQKGKLNANKRQKNIIFRSVGLADWFLEFQIRAKAVLKISWSVKTPRQLLAPAYGLLNELMNIKEKCHPRADVETPMRLQRRIN